MQTPYASYSVGQAYGAAPAGAADPIISRLRPRDMMGILDQSFRLYRRHFLTFVAIIAVIHVPIQLLIQAATISLLGPFQSFLENPSSTRSLSSGATTEMFTNSIVLYVAIGLLSILHYFFLYLAQGALTAGIADSYLDKPVSFGGAYRQMFGHVGPLLGLMVLQVLVGIAVFVPAFVPFICALSFAGAAGDNGGGALFASACLMFLLIILAFAVYVYIYVRLQLVVPAVMVENLGPVQAMRRSWRLVQGYAWRTFGLVVLLVLLNYVISAGPAALVSGLAAYFIKFNFVMQQAVTGVIGVLATMFYIPIQLTALTLYYFDLRVRREGFDIESAMAQRYWPQGQGAYPQGGQQPYGQAPANPDPMSPPPLGYGVPPATYNYNPIDPTQGGWPTPTPTPAPQSESPPPQPETSVGAPPEVPTPEEPYPTPDWLRRPPDVAPPDKGGAGGPVPQEPKDDTEPPTPDRA